MHCLVFEWAWHSALGILRPRQVLDVCFYCIMLLSWHLDYAVLQDCSILLTIAADAV